MALLGARHADCAAMTVFERSPPVMRAYQCMLPLPSARPLPGDVVPTNTLEYLVDCGVIAVGVLMFGLAMGSLVRGRACLTC